MADGPEGRTVIERLYVSLHLLWADMLPEENADKIPPAPGYFAPADRIQALRDLAEELRPIVELLRTQNSMRIEYRPGDPAVWDGAEMSEAWIETPACFRSGKGPREILAALVSRKSDTHPAVISMIPLGAAAVLRICLDALAGRHMTAAQEAPPSTPQTPISQEMSPDPNERSF